MEGDVSICCHQLAAVTDPDKAAWGTYCSIFVVFVPMITFNIVYSDQQHLLHILQQSSLSILFIAVVHIIINSPILNPLQKKELLFICRNCISAKGQKVYFSFLCRPLKNKPLCVSRINYKSKAALCNVSFQFTAGGLHERLSC